MKNYVNTIIASRMLKYLKVPPNNLNVTKIICSLLDEAIRLLDIKKWSKHLPIDEFYDLFHPYACESQSINKLFKYSKSVWLMVVSLGYDLEQRSREYLKNNEVFKGYILDRLGSFLVEEEIRFIDLNIIHECCINGYTTTHRFSPGYGDFSIQAQQIFLNLVKDSIPELRISSGYHLVPDKTVTAVKGVIKL